MQNCLISVDWYFLATSSQSWQPRFPGIKQGTEYAQDFLEEEILSSSNMKSYGGW